MAIILDTNGKKIHKDWCDLLKKTVDSKYQKRVETEKDIPEHYTRCEKCNLKKSYDDTKWGSLV